jgi:hypothetical protein
MIDPDRDLHKGVVEMDPTENPTLPATPFSSPGPPANSLVAGAVELIDRSAGKPKPRRRGAKCFNTLSGRLRLAVIADNSAKSIEAFVRDNVKPDATVITYGHASYTGLSGDHRHDPRVVGAILLPRSHRAHSPMKRWAWHVSRPANTSRFTSMNCLSLQPPLSSPRLVRSGARGVPAHCRPRTYWDIAQRDNPLKSAVRSQLLHLVDRIRHLEPPVSYASH